MINNNKVKTVFYINKEDKDLVKSQCDLLQIKPSFFIRNAVLEKLKKPVFEVECVKIDTKIYISQLMKIGVNLNQIAKKLNSNAKFMIADQKEVLDNIKLITEHILEIKSQL